MALSLKQVAEFVDQYHENFGVVFHTDPDGISAAALVCHAYRRKFGGSLPRATISCNPNIPFVTKELAKEIDSYNGMAVLFLDMVVDEDATYLFPLSRKHKIAVLDNHRPNKRLDLNKEDILHVNSYFLGPEVRPEYHCASKATYDTFNPKVNIRDLNWIVGTGMIGDDVGKKWKRFFDDEIYEIHPLLKVGGDRYGWDCELGRLARTIGSAHSYGGDGPFVALQAYLEASDAFDILKEHTDSSKRLVKMMGDVDKEIETFVSMSKNKAEQNKVSNLVFYDIHTTLNIQKELATRLGEQNPNLTFVVTRTEGDYTYVEIRRKDCGTDCSELARYLVKDFEGASGGGHREEAGAHIPAKDFKKLRNRIRGLKWK